MMTAAQLAGIGTLVAICAAFLVWIGFVIGVAWKSGVVKSHVGKQRRNSSQ